MEEENMEGLYGDLEDTDLGEQIHKLERVNKKLKTHIGNLESDIAKLMNEVVGLKKTQDTLTKNISELFKTAQAELQRKDSIIADLRSKLDDVILRRVGRKRPPQNNEQNQAHIPKQTRPDKIKNDDNRLKNLGSKDDKHCKTNSKNEYHDRGNVLCKNVKDGHTKNTLNFEKQGQNNSARGRCDNRRRKLNLKDENHLRFPENDDILCRNVERRKDRSRTSNSHDFPLRKATDIKDIVNTIGPNSDDRRSRSNSRDKWNKLTDVEGVRSRNMEDRRRHDQRGNLQNLKDLRCRIELPRRQNERSMKFNRDMGDSRRNHGRYDNGTTFQTNGAKRKHPEDMEEGEISIIDSSEDEILETRNFSNKIPEGKTSVDEEQFKKAQILPIENIREPTEETTNIETPRNDNESTKPMTDYQTPQEIPNITKEQICSDLKIGSEIVSSQQVEICLEYKSLNGANNLSNLVANNSSLTSNNIMVGDITNSSLVMNSNVGLSTPGSVNIRRKRRRCVVQLND